MSSSKTRVAVVSGSNKGIGFAVVRGLCKQFDGDVYLTSRSEELGKKAVEELNKEKLNPKYHQLDITDEASIARLASFLKDKYGGLDILVNNAAIAYKGSSDAPFSEQAEVTIKTNFWGTLNICNALFPLLRPHARVVNVSSFVAQWGMNKCSEDIQKQFRNANISMEELCKLMQEFVNSAQTNDHQKKGFPGSAYAVSKIGQTVMTFIQQRQLDSKDDIVVNACDPGSVDTDMSSHKGTKTIDQGADTPLYGALLPPNISSPRGQFLSDKKIGKL